MIPRLEKFHFFSESVDHLGHAIRPVLLEVASKNTYVVAKAKVRRTRTGVPSFLGLCHVYRRFVKRFSTVAALLADLTSKKYSLKLLPLTEQQLIAIEELRLRLRESY